MGFVLEKFVPFPAQVDGTAADLTMLNTVVWETPLRDFMFSVCVTPFLAFLYGEERVCVVRATEKFDLAAIAVDISRSLITSKWLVL